MTIGPGSWDILVFFVIVHPLSFVDGTTDLAHSQQCRVGAVGPSHKLLLHVTLAMSKKMKKKSC
jgi:hypothetical protein